MATKNIEDAYPLSPMQEGLLFHSLYAQEHDVYITHITCELENLDTAAFERAWQQVVDRHPALRTAFVWENVKQPLQVVGRRVRLGIEQHDWRDLPEAEQNARFDSHLAGGGALVFKLSKAPLVRLTLFRVGDDKYKFLYSHHHLLLDGWSDYLLLKEVFTFYGAHRQGQALHLPAPRPFRDYIAWLKNQDAARAEQFWREMLSGFKAPTPLGIDLAPGHLPSQEERSYEFRLSAETTAALHAMARQHRLTLSTIIQGAWALLLSRYSGESDIVFGVTVSGRPPEMPGVETMMGVFINTLPMRVQVRPDAALAAWLSEIQTRQMEIRQFEYSSLVQVQGWSEVPRGLPLFNSTIDIENHTATAPLSNAEQSLKIRDVRTNIKMDHPLFVKASPGPELLFTVSYDRRRFDTATIERIGAHLQTLFGSFTSNPQQRLSDISMLSEEERRQVLFDWNSERADFPLHLPLHHFFEQQVTRSPLAPALLFEEHSLSYLELNERANQLAHHLRSLGIGPEHLVALLMHRSVELVVSLLAILKCGAAYLPLDTEAPPARLRFMLADARAPLLLTQQALASSLTSSSATTETPPLPPLLVVDGDDAALWADEPTTNPAVEVLPQSLAYVIYTSGSTGQPKAAMNTHEAIVNRLLWMQHAYQITSADAVLQKTPYSFDVSVWEFFWPLMAGARLVLARAGGHRDAQYLVELIEGQQVSVLHFVPSLLRVFLQEAEVERCRSVRLVVASGEAMTAELIEEFEQRWRWAQLENLYGPTEAAVDVTRWRCRRVGAGEAVPIGRAIANVEVYVLDAGQREVGVGMMGELYIGGVAVGRGYLGRAELTAERYVPDAYSGRAGGRLYRTGDVVRWNGSGEIEYVGRADEQVKVRGLRIELGEIEAVVRSHAGVGECAVRVWSGEEGGGGGGGSRVVGYVVKRGGGGEGGGGVRWEEVKEWVRERLPEYMVPVVWVEMGELPKTTSGKINRKALPPPQQGLQEQRERVAVPPRTEVERILAGIWAEVLRLDHVGINDNFFELGGDSILSIKIVSRANQAGLRLTHKHLFQYRTIAELATVAGTAPLSAAEQGLVSGHAPLTPIQHWFFHHLLLDSHHWNQSLLLQLRSTLSADHLSTAVSHLLRHHDALRLRFNYDPASGWQQHHAPADEPAPVTSIDLSHLNPQTQPAAISEDAAGWQRTLNLQQGPLLRVVLYDLGPQQPQRLLLVLHHLIVDGVSWRILLEDLEAAYRQAAAGEAVALARKTMSYKQWAELLQEQAQSAAVRAELGYWTAAERRHVAPLPVDRAEGVGENTYGSAATVQRCLSEGETRALLVQVPEAYQTQINEVLLTALVEVVRRWSGARRVVIDLEGHGREAIAEGVDVTRTVGWFTSVVPVVVEVWEEWGEGEGLKRVKEQLRRVPGRGVGYGMLRYVSREEGVREELERMEEAEMSFNYLGQLDQVLPDTSIFMLADEPTGPPRSPTDRRRYLLEVEAKILSGQLHVEWVYSERVHSRGTVEMLAEDFQEALRDIISHCQSPDAGGYTPSDFPKAKMSQGELDDLISELG